MSLSIAILSSKTTRVVNSYFLSAEAKRNNGFDYNGYGSVINYTISENMLMYVPVAELFDDSYLFEYYTDDAITLIKDAGKNFPDSKFYVHEGGAPSGWVINIHGDDNVEVIHWALHG